MIKINKNFFAAVVAVAANDAVAVTKVSKQLAVEATGYAVISTTSKTSDMANKTVAVMAEASVALNSRTQALAMKMLAKQKGLGC